MQGNKQAIAIMTELAATSLDIIINDALGRRYEAGQAQKWLQARLAGKDTRRQLTDAIKDYMDTHTTKELALIDRLEGHAVTLIDNGLDPYLATQDALDFYQAKLPHPL